MNPERGGSGEIIAFQKTLLTVPGKFGSFGVNSQKAEFIGLIKKMTGERSTLSAEILTISGHGGKFSHLKESICQIGALPDAGGSTWSNSWPHKKKGNLD